CCRCASPHRRSPILAGRVRARLEHLPNLGQRATGAYRLAEYAEQDRRVPAGDVQRATLKRCRPAQRVPASSWPTSAVTRATAAWSAAAEITNTGHLIGEDVVTIAALRGTGCTGRRSGGVATVTAPRGHRHLAPAASALLRLRKYRGVAAEVAI